MVRRIHFPTGVMRGSSVSLKLPPSFFSAWPAISFFTYSLCFSALLFTYMERNLRNVKREPYPPTVFCLKKPGLLELIFTEIAIAKNREEKKKMEKNDPAISIA